MRTVQTIAFALAGQKLTCDAPEGRPSSVTSVAVHRWDESDIQDLEAHALGGSGTVETGPSTTLDGDVIAGARSIPLTATTGAVIGRDYLITSAAGLREWVEVTAIVAADSVSIRCPLHNAYASSATFQSTRMTVDVSDSWAADLINFHPLSRANPMFRVRWVYVVAGVSYVTDTYFNLARYPGRHGVLPHNVDDMHPGWLDRLPIDHRPDQGRRLIDEAYRSVKIDLAQVEVAEWQVAESEIIDELVRHKTIELGEWARFMSGGGDADRHEEAEEKYTARLDGFVRQVKKVPVRLPDGAARPAVSIGLSRR